ncbi:hypothetical protein F5Y15DRAFT_428488 [Xylariaceae sp. FL0016]|nr:hypothetical protein F5Y15DRAFT_428488 [Xylariaceae sp. FL0016]
MSLIIIVLKSRITTTVTITEDGTASTVTDPWAGDILESPASSETSIASWITWTWVPTDEVSEDASTGVTLYATAEASNPTPTATDSSQQPNSDSSLSDGAIAGIAVGAILVLAPLASLLWLVIHYRRKALALRGGSGPEVRENGLRKAGNERDQI